MHIPFVKLSTYFILLTLNVWIALHFAISLYRNKKQKYFHYKTYNIMNTLNSTQKLFTTSQLIGLIFISAVVITLVVAIATGDISGFNNVGLGK